MLSEEEFTRLRLSMSLYTVHTIWMGSGQTARACVFVLMTSRVSLRLLFSLRGWTQAERLGITGWWTECIATETVSAPRIGALSLWINMEDKYPLVGELAADTDLLNNITVFSFSSSLLSPLLARQRSSFPSLHSSCHRLFLNCDLVYKYLLFCKVSVYLSLFPQFSVGIMIHMKLRGFEIIWWKSQGSLGGTEFPFRTE